MEYCAKCVATTDVLAAKITTYSTVYGVPILYPKPTPTFERF